MDKGSDKESNMQMLSESENYAIWVSYESDAEGPVYHIEIGNVTLHLFEEEWEEFMHVVMEAVR